MTRHMMMIAAAVMLAGCYGDGAGDWVLECEPDIGTRGNLTLTETSVTWNGETINTPMYFAQDGWRWWTIDERNKIYITLEPNRHFQLFVGWKPGALLYEFGEDADDADTASPSETWLCY